VTSSDLPTAASIRVLWLIKGLGPGGAEQLLLSSAAVADRETFAYDVAYVRPDKDQLVKSLRELGVTVFRLGQSGSWLTDLRQRLGHYDIVHVHSPLLAGAVRLLARSIARGRRPIIVSTEHNVWSNFSRPTRLLNALTGRMDDKRWAVSHEVKRSMWSPLATRTGVLRHGIDLGAAPPPPSSRAEIRRSLGIANDAPVVICVANLRKEKDYPNLMRAAATVLESHPDAVFLAVGQGPLETELAALHTRMGLGDRFRFLGYREDVRALLSAADVFALGSLQEGLPVAIMEALHQGLPIVATDVGGVGEAVTDGVNGFLVAPSDSGALASALIAVLEDPELRHRLGVASRTRAAEFDIRQTVALEEDVYKRLVRERAAAL